MNDVSSFYQMHMMYAEAYAPNVVMQLKQKFKQQDENLDDASMEWYINRFNVIKDSPRIANFARRVFQIKQPMDVFSYTWDQLETIVDQLPAPETQPPPRVANDVAAPAKLIYDENNLKIYDAPNQQACIQMGQREFGKAYSFCVSRTNDGNLYNSYRFKQRSFYFVYDASLPRSNEHHLIVIQVSSDGKYHLTTAINSGDVLVTWQQIEQAQPKLRGLQQLFVYHPFSAQEKLSVDVQHIDANGFDPLNYSKKSAYIAASKNIHMNSWLDLPRELKKMYTDLAANRQINNFFAIELSNALQDADPVRMLQDHLPQEKGRFVERIKQNYQNRGASLATIHGKSYYVEMTWWVELTQKVLQNVSNDVKSAIKTLNPSFSQMQVALMYDAQTFEFVATLLRISYENGIIIDFILRDDELQKCCITFEGDATAMMDFEKDVAALKAVVLELARFDVAALKNSSPQLYATLADAPESEYAKQLFSHCIIHDEQIDDEGFAAFMKQMMQTIDMLEVDQEALSTNATTRSGVVSMLEKSQLFKQMLQRHEMAKQLLTPLQAKNQQVYVMTLRDSYSYRDRVVAFDGAGEFLSLYLHSYGKLYGYTPPSSLLARAQDDDELPKYIIPKRNALNNVIAYVDGEPQVEALRQKRDKALQRKRSNPETSEAYKHYIHLKSLNYDYEYLEYVQQHGVRNAIKVGRKTLMNTNPAFIGQYANTSMALSMATLSNLTELAQGLNIAWDKIYIQPVTGRAAFSFFIEGKNDADQKVYYCRKEFPAPGAGQSFLINADTGAQQLVSSALRALREA
jgi:hypothetical protein